MHLDDITEIEQIDQSGMIKNIRNLSDQIQNGWNSSIEKNFETNNKLERIIYIGFQDNPIVIEILQLLISPYYSRPFLTIEENLIPEWCQSQNLVVLKINQTNIDEFVMFIKNNFNSKNRIIALVKENELKIRLSKLPITVIDLIETSFSRNTIGYDVMFLSGILFKMGLIPDLLEEILKCRENLEQAKQHLELEIKSSLNPAKRLAGQMVGRWIKIVSGGAFLPLAKYWNQQLNKSAKTISIFEDIGDLVNFSINGIVNPGSIVQQSMIVFLKSDLIEEKVNNLLDKTKEELMCYGIGTDFYQTRGSSLFSQIWNTILFGDYMAYYLAIAYECDPEPIMVIEN